MVSLTLKYKDGSSFFVGNFPTQAEADAWLKVEQAKKYWDPLTQIDAIDDGITTEVDREKTRKAIEDFKKAKKDKADTIKDLIKQKPKTVADCAALLEKIADFLDLN